MNILICYASTEGQTRKIARFCAGQLIAAGHSVEVIAASDADETPLETFDAAILAGSVHVGKIQDSLAAFAETHAHALNAMPTLYLQVSLAVVAKEDGDQEELDKIATKFCKAAGWTPGATHQIAGAFRFSQYDFFKNWAMRWIASRGPRTVEPGTDTEFTDWEELAAILKGWPAT